MENAMNEETHWYLMQLPELVRKVIYNYLWQSDALNFRLVSKQYRDDIDSTFRFNFQLDDTKQSKEQMEFLLNLKIRECRVYALSKKIYTSIFKYPHEIEDLVINLTSKIDLRNFETLLRECSPYVVQLNVSLAYKSGTNTNQLDLNIPPLYNFKQLKVLALWQEIPWQYSDAECINRTIFNRIWKSAENSNIEGLNIQFSRRGVNAHPDHDEFPNRAFELTDKWKELEHFLYESGSFSNSVFNSGEEIVGCLQKVRNLKDISIVVRDKSLGVDYYGSNNLRFIIKKDFELRENNMTILTVVCQCQEILDPMGFPTIVQKNLSTLESVRVFYDTSEMLKEDLDFSMFRYCNQLKVLEIKFKFDIDSDNLRLRNLDALPKSIEKLKLRGFHIEHGEMERFFVSELTNLKYLSLGTMEKEIEFQVSNELWRDILNLKEILKLHVLGLKLSEKFRNRWATRAADWGMCEGSCTCNFTTDEIHWHCILLKGLFSVLLWRKNLEFSGEKMSFYNMALFYA